MSVETALGFPQEWQGLVVGLVILDTDYPELLRAGRMLQASIVAGVVRSKSFHKYERWSKLLKGNNILGIIQGSIIP